MEDFKEQLAEILEIDTNEIDFEKNLEDYDSWDSLAALSLISLADTDYNKSINRAKLLELKTVGELYRFLSE